MSLIITANAQGGGGESFAHGDELTLTGTGFEVVLPGLWDTVDNITAYAGLSDGDTIPDTSGYPWSDNTFNDPDRVKYETSGNRHANNTAHYFADAPGYLQYPRAMSSAGAEDLTLYISFYFKPLGSIPGTGHSSKFMRVWDDTGGLGTRISWTQDQLTYDDIENTAPVNWGGWGGSTGAWNRMEMFVDLTNNIIRCWTNFNLQHDVSDAAQHPGGVGEGIQLSRIGFDLGGVSPPDIDIEFGEIYVARSQARIELANAATWAERTKSEIQPAIGSPSSTVVQTQVNRGSLDSGTNHAFAINGAGTATYLREVEIA